MDDDIARRRRRKNLTWALVLGGVLAFALGPTLWQTVIVASRPLPGYAAAAPAGEYVELKWGDLRRGKWEPGSKPTVAKTIADNGGKRTKVRGFMLPLHTPGASSEFFLAPSPGGCYFCSPPGVAEIVMLKTHGGAKADVTQLPVEAYGTLRVATGAATDQALYVVEDAVLTAIR
jgi:hypothetical protein